MHSLLAKYFVPNAEKFMQADTYHVDRLNLYAYAENIKENMMNKMKIIPVKVPWMISPSYEIEEYSGGISFVNIFLYCLNSKEQQNKEIEKLNKLYNNNIPEEIWNEVGYMNIELHFESVNYFAIIYPQQEVFGLNEEKYDMSMVEPYYDGSLDLEEIWSEEGFCPNPKMYEVENSILKKTLNITDDSVKHWLITGHEEEVHILSKDYVWKKIEPPIVKKTL